MTERNQELSTQTAKTEIGAIEKALIGGDLGGLKPEERVTHYMRVCDSLGLNPHTNPFGYLVLNGKTVLYAKREATEQLRKVNGVSITALDGRIVDDLYVVTASAKDKDGRVDSSTGAVPLKGLFGEAKANAIMKAETKAKRRVTLSICGLGMLDENETSSIPGARTVEAEVAHVALNLGEGQKTAEVVEQGQEASSEQTAKTPHLTVAMDELNRMKGTIEACQNIDELKKAWDEVPQAYKGALKALKETRKNTILGGTLA